MRASAHLAVAADGAGTRICRLRSDPPIVLRPTVRAGSEPLRAWNLGQRRPARVSVATGAAGPLGGDDLRLTVDVGPGAVLVLRTVAATLALPGAHDQPSRTELTVRVAATGVLVWLPGPTIAARGCRHSVLTRVCLEPGARGLLREELVLGRHGEPSGTVRQRLRVEVADAPVHDQEVSAGPDAPGWDGAAVLAGRRAVGSLLVVDPGRAPDGVELLPRRAPADGAVLPLGGGATLVTALANDGLALRRLLDAGLALLDG